MFTQKISPGLHWRKPNRFIDENLNCRRRLTRLCLNSYFRQWHWKVCVREEDLCGLSFFVYLNYQFNYLDTSCELFLGKVETQPANKRKRINTIELVVIAMFETSLAHMSRELLFYRIRHTIRCKRLWTLRLYGQFERQ